jgi:hypothetical protein
MQRADREAKLQRAKAVGRIAYSHVRWAERTSQSTARKSNFRAHRAGIEIELAASFRAYARPDEFSRLRIRVHGEKVFEIRWDKAGGFKIVHYDQGDWERTLRAWPAPIPFD